MAKRDDEFMSPELEAFARAELLDVGRVNNLLNSTEREVVIAVAVISDRLLGECLRAYFGRKKKSDAKQIESLLSGHLKDFYVRHEMCKALYLIGKETRDALSQIREIRLSCAHHEIFSGITDDHVNGLRGTCPTLLKKPNISLTQHILDFHPELKWSENRARFMDVFMRLYAVLANAKVGIETKRHFYRF